MVVTGFIFAHAIARNEIASLPPPAVQVSTKLLPGLAQYSLDSVSEAKKILIFGGGQLHRTISTEQGTPITLYGWAIDNHLRKAAAGVFAELDSKVTVTGTYGVFRPDVAKAMNNPLYANCGFSILIAGNELSKGSHDVALDIDASDGSGRYREKNILTIVVH